MSEKAGALLWNRMRLTVATTPGGVDVDTGITQPNRSFADYSPGEPPLGTSGTAAPINGTLPASRLQVVPLAPTANWAGITHSEPYFNTTTGTMHVVFTNSTEGSVEINVLFWDPHSLVGPGDADTYRTAPPT